MRRFCSNIQTNNDKYLYSKVVSIHLWNTPRATFTRRHRRGISFIIGESRGLSNGCAISGCVETTFDIPIPSMYDIFNLP